MAFVWAEIMALPDFAFHTGSRPSHTLPLDCEIRRDRLEGPCSEWVGVGVTAAGEGMGEGGGVGGGGDSPGMPATAKA